MTPYLVTVDVTLTAQCQMHVLANSPEEAEKLARSFHDAGVFAALHPDVDDTGYIEWTEAFKAAGQTRFAGVSPHQFDDYAQGYSGDYYITDFEVQVNADPDAAHLFEDLAAA